MKYGCYLCCSSPSAEEPVYDTLDEAEEHIDTHGGSSDRELYIRRIETSEQASLGDLQ